MKSIAFDRYKAEMRDSLMKELGLKNPMQVPALEKIVINVGMGSYLQRLGRKDFSNVVDNVRRIAGQQPVVKRAKLSVSNFKLRQGMPVGVTVTLRGDRAYDFLDKLVNVVFPRVRDFRGVRKNIFDKFGNCSFGFSDYTVFPEVELPENAREIHGMQITVVTSSPNEDGARAFLKAFNFPFQK